MIRKRQKSEPAHTKVSKQLGVDIVNGRYQPGDTIPGELDIAEELLVSRSVVREALRMLAARGLLESKPKVGTRVRDRQHWNLLDPSLLEWMFESEPPAQFVRALFELRLIVEPAAVELAAQRRTPKHLAAMGHALETMSEYGLDTTEGQLADQRFHAAILEATDNELLVNLSASIGAAVRWTTYYKFRKNRRPRDIIELHQSVFEAIAIGDTTRARSVAVALIEQAHKDTEDALQG